MPWTADDFKKFKDGLGGKQAARAARIANAILKSCLGRGGTQDECERIAIATALKAVSEEGSMEFGEVRFTDRPWNGDKARFDVDQLLGAVPRAVAAWARKRAKDNGRDVIKDDLVLPYKEPDGTVNINGVRNALARLSQVKGVPQDVLADAREELKRVLDEYRKRTGQESAWAQSAVLNDKIEKYREQNGLVRVPLALARAGVYVWERPMGEYKAIEGVPLELANVYVWQRLKGEYRALEREEEIFSPEFMAQFRGLPITLDHPDSGTLEEGNLEKYIVGWVGGDVYRSGDMLYGEGVIFSKRAIEAMSSGDFELSKGYWCDVREESGEWKGQKYDVVHENIILDHIAIVPRGVCGTCRVLIESGGHKCACGQENDVCKGGDMEKIKVTIEGKEFVLTEDDASVKLLEQAIAERIKSFEAQRQELERVKGELDGARKELEALKAAKQGEAVKGAELEAKVSAYKAKCETLEKELAAFKDGRAVEALVQERKQLEAWAEKYAPDFACAGKTNTEIRVALIQAIDKEFNAEGKSECEIKTRCEAMMKVLERVGTASPAVHKQAPDRAQRLAILKDAIRGRSARLPENRKSA